MYGTVVVCPYNPTVLPYLSSNQDTQGLHSL